MSSDYSHLYKPADRYFKINDLDEDRKTIVISLPPEPANLNLIDGYGLPPEQQFFRRKETPYKLVQIEREAIKELQDIQKQNRQETVTGYKIIDRFWEKVEDRSDELKEEIEFIKHIWWWRYNGYWFYNDGKPTYITGRHFMFLNFFYQPDIKDNDGYPEYRDRHRREFLFREYLRHTTESFAKRDEKGWAIPNEDGSYTMIDMGTRTFFGDIHPKNRRNGSTMMALSDMIEDSERAFGIYSTIVSKDGESTEEHYNLKLLPAWSNRPYFIRPIWQGSSQPVQIKYFPPKNSYAGECLMGVIDYTVSAAETKKDGSKINGMLVADEEGKVGSGVNVLQRWDVNKNAQALGDGTKIIGYSSHISTVEEINASGLAYLDMLELSDFYQRGDNGQTTSGLADMGIPSYDGLENFIDRFGYSVINKPTDRQIELSPNAFFAKVGKGAKQYQTEKRDDFLKKGTPAAMQSYRAYVKKYPWKKSELYFGTVSDMGFDYEVLDNRLMELRKMKSLEKMPYKVGNFERENRDPEGRVLWKTDPENGKFRMSLELPVEQANLKRETLIWDATKGMMVKGYEPVYKSRFTCGADPVEYSNSKDVTSSKESDVGIAVLRERDMGIDFGDDPHSWQTRLFCLSYRNRSRNPDEANEDILMACEYYGAMLYLERNKTATWQYFIRRKRGGYLKYDVDLETGKRAEKPGFYSLTNSKDELFSEIKKYIDERGHMEVFDEFLQECRDIRGKDEMTKYDRFTAHGAALLGSRSIYGQIQDNVLNNTIDISDSGFF